MTNQTNNPTTRRECFEIYGYYFEPAGPDGKKATLSDTSFYDGTYSMIDHQKMWHNEAQKLGYISGDIDEERIIQTNYRGELTEEQLIAIINDGTLMDTPFRELFPKAIKAYIKSELENEYADLEQYVLKNEGDKDCSAELVQMKELQRQVARLSRRVS